MPTFSRFDVVSVPFPCTDRPVRQRRPALVVSSPAHERATGLVWVVMITAAENRPWPGDVRLADARRAGLSIPSVVWPTKIATIEAGQASRVGTITPSERRAVRAAIGEILG
ncbi:MAG: type II toxin-antitoxin system PemK/MazF family toxin [Rhodospirillales bacterium]|nr:type II toxin-antitoxin system PemK/MazF family toxin [Rhodospirillales bacterium]